MNSGRGVSPAASLPSAVTSALPSKASSVTRQDVFDFDDASARCPVAPLGLGPVSDADLDTAPAADPVDDDLHSDAIRPESLHPSLWFGHQLAREAASVVATGFPELDAQLPGGGWPRKALVELLLPQPGIGEMRLVAPSLAAIQRRGRLLMLFDPPGELSGVALEQLGLDVAELLVIHTRARVIPGTDSLWALEQALKSGHVGAVLAWLPPRLRAERLRRLQLAAHAHDGPAFVFCEPGAANRPTAAPLRLALKAAEADVLSVRILKRRGPLLDKPLRLPLPPVLSKVARQRLQRLQSAATAEASAASRLRNADPAGLEGATFVDLGSGLGAGRGTAVDGSAG